MKKYVFIQSDRNINVTSGLDVKNITNPSLAVKDNMKVKALWPQTTVMLLQGKHLYPIVVSTFKSVQSLKEQGFVSIDGYTNDLPEDSKDKTRILELNKKLRSLTDKLLEKEEQEKSEKQVKKETKAKD